MTAPDRAGNGNFVLRRGAGGPRATLERYRNDEPSFATSVSPDGSPVRGRDPARPLVAIRAEMGRLPLPCLPRWRARRAAIEIRSAAHALLSRVGVGAGGG